MSPAVGLDGHKAERVSMKVVVYQCDRDWAIQISRTGFDSSEEV